MSAKLGRTVLELIDESLAFRPSRGEANPNRCMMLLHRSSIAMNLVCQHISRQATMKVVTSSKFPEDINSDSYNLVQIRLIKDLAAKGCMVILDDVNNAIQTSLYDLLNKTYSRCNGRLYFRISLGANHEPRCLLDPRFNAIMLVEERRLIKLDSPFLSRFEKHRLNLDSMLTRRESDLLGELLDWR